MESVLSGLRRFNVQGEGDERFRIRDFVGSMLVIRPITPTLVRTPFTPSGVTSVVLADVLIVDANPPQLWLNVHVGPATITDRLRHFPVNGNLALPGKLVELAKTANHPIVGMDRLTRDEKERARVAATELGWELE